MLSTARVFADFGLLRQKAAYAGTVAGLLLLLWLGHRTHWRLNEVISGSIATHGQAHIVRRVGESAPGVATSHPETSDDGVLVVSEAAMAKAGVELGRVERRAMSTSIVASGVVAYNQNLRAELATRAAGHVWRIEKHIGEPIHKGDVLAIVEAREVGQAKGELLQAIVMSELKATNFERMKQLGGTVAERQVREAEAAMRQAQIHAQVCVQALVNLGLPLTSAELKGLDDDERARRIQFAGLPESIVESLDPRTTTANLVPLLAPFDGVVIGRDMAVGEVVSPDQPEFEIADVRKVWVLLEVRKEDATQLRIGQTVVFRPDGHDGEVRGPIDWISTAVDEKTRTLQVRAQVENPASLDPTTGQTSYLLRAHTYGTGRVIIRDEQAALVVPQSAVHFDGASPFVFVYETGTFRRAAIEIGSQEKGQIEVRIGLDEGMTVATAGSHALKAQMQLVAATR
jgi:cobalt-zinc-cadmium efflux system membrane fusion protein